MMFSRQLSARLPTLRAPALVLLALAASACGSDHIVSVDVGAGSHRVTARMGDLVDIRLFAGALGIYASPPAISAPVVVFVGVSLDSESTGIISPGGPTQRFRFRAESRGTAIVTFSPEQNAPIVKDTIVVQ